MSTTDPREAAAAGATKGSTGVEPDLTPDTQVRDAARQVLIRKAGPLFDLEAAAASGDDADAIHDMRVASRRVREALRVFAPLYRRKARATIDDLARSVTRALGRVRDADVLIGAFERLAQQAATDEERAVLAYLIGYRRGLRESELVRMRKGLARLELARQRRRFDRAVGDVSGGSADDRPLGDLAREVILARLEEFAAHLPDALESDAIEAQHSMRIAGKHLRYAIETLAPCVRSEEYDDLHARLVKYQDLLGEMHDCDVWTAFVGQAGKTREAARAGASAEGVETLLVDLDARRAGFFEEFRAHLDESGPEVLGLRIRAALLPPTSPPSTALVAGERGPSSTQEESPSDEEPP